MPRFGYSHFASSRQLLAFWVFIASFFSASACLSQITANAAQGDTPYGVYSVGDIDNINILNGNVFVKIPLLSYPQRGKDLKMDFYIYANDKQWYIGNFQVSTSGAYTGAWTGGAFTTGTTPEPLVGAYVARDQDLGFGVDASSSSYTAGGEPFLQYTVTTTNNGFFAITGDGSKHYMGDAVYIRCQTQGGGTCPSLPTVYGNQYPATDATGFLPISIGFPGSTTEEVKDFNGVDYKAISTNLQLPTFSTQTTQTDRNGNVITVNNSGWTDTVGRPIPGSYSGPGGAPGNTEGSVPSAPSEPIPGTPMAQGQLGDCPSGTVAARDWAVPAHDGSTQHYYLCYQNFAYQTAFDLDQVLNTNLYENVPEASSSQQGNEPDLLLTAVVIPGTPNPTSYTFSYDQYLSLTQITLPTGGSITYTWQNIAFDPFNGTRPISRAVKTRTLTPGDGQPAETWTYHWHINYTTGPNGAFYASYPIWHIVTDPTGNDVEHQLERDTEDQTVYYSGCGPHDTTSDRTCSGSGSTLKTVSYAYTEYDSGGVTVGTPAFVTPGSSDPLYKATTITTTLPTGTSGQSLVSQEVITPTPKYGTCQQYYGYNGAQPEFQTITPCYSLNQNQMVAYYDYGINAPGSILTEDSYQYLRQDTSRGPAYLTANVLSPIESQSVVGPPSNSTWSVTTFGYDENNGSPQGALGNLTSVTTAAGKSQTVFNNQGVPTTQIDPNGNKTFTSSFQCSGAFPQTIIRPYQSSTTLAEKTSYVYDCDTGKVTSITDPNLQVTSYTYSDPLSRLKTVTYPDIYPGSSTHGQTQYTYTDTPSSAHVTVAETMSPTSTKQTEYDVDGLGRLIYTRLLTAPVAPYIMARNYDSKGRVASISNPYQSTGDPTYGVTQYIYDGLDRLTKQIDQDGSSDIQWCYDGVPTNGQTNCTTNKSSVTTGSWVDYTDEMGHHWQRVSDALTRLTALMEPDGSADTTPPTLETDYQYNPLNNLTWINQHGLVRTFTYDSLSRLVCASNPESATAPCPSTVMNQYPASATTYGYDANGNVINKVSPAPNSAWGSGATANTTYQYDALNRLTYELAVASTAPNTFTHYFYYDQASLFGITFANPIGTLTATAASFSGSPQTVASSTLYWNHDARGRVLGMKTCTPATCNSTNIADSTWYDLSNTYDLTGNTISYTDGFGTTISPHYDGAGQLSSVTSSKNNATLWTANSYGPVGLTQATFGNGVEDTLQYTSKRAWLQSANTVNASGQTIYSEGLIYYPNGSPQTVTDSVNGNWSYVYDNLNRISTAVSANTGQGCQFAYDSFGNRTQQTTYQGSCSSEFLTFSTPTNHIDGYCYDAAGNLLDAGGCAPSGVHHQNFYDAYGNLLTGNYNSSNLTSYTVDSLGHRVAKFQGSGIERMYLYGVDGNPVAEMDGAGNWLQTNVRAGGQFIAEYQGTAIYFMHADHLGTIRAESNSAGMLVLKCTNQPFGDMLACNGASNPSGYHFTGKERDVESGLDYFGKRYYASSMGRWLSPDRVSVTDERLLNPANTLNLYAYGANNPLKYVDPDGQDITYFYDQGGVAGHAVLFAYNQGNRDWAIESFGPNIHFPIGRGESDFDMSQFKSAQDLRDTYAAITIQANPELTQEVIDYIRNNPDPSVWFMTGPNCSTQCGKILHHFKLDYQKSLVKRNLTPKYLFKNLMKRYNPSQQNVKPSGGVDYGHPEFDMFNLFWQSIQSGDKATVTATATNCIAGNDGQQHCDTQ